jgi:hypothetical protein
MSLAGIKYLQSAGLLGDFYQPLRIFKHQPGALVSSHATREPEGENFGIEHQPGARRNLR